MSLLAKELKDLRFRLIVMIILVIGLALFVLGFYDFFVKAIDINQISATMENSIMSNYISPELLTSQLTELVNNMDYYVWSQWFGKNFMQLILLGLILFGFSTFAREREHKTNSFLLTNFTRKQVFSVKVYAGLISLIILIIIGSMLPVVIGILKSFDFSLGLAVKYFIQILPPALFLYALIILFSVLAKDLIKPIIFGVLSMIFLSLVGKIEMLKSLHLFRYLSGFDIFFHNQINYISVIIFILLAIITLQVTYRIYKNQDF